MNLQPIHKAELGLLDIFLRFCTDYHLTYFLIGGSMLGAVRHEGFIPWDDDLDIGMPRADYNKFLKVAPAVLGHTAYFLQTPFSDKNYGLSYSKLIDTDTYIEEFNNVNYAKKGIFIDIFPIDVISENAAEQVSQISRLKLYDGSIIVRLGYSLTDSTILKLFRPLSTDQYAQVRKIKHQRDDLMQQYEHSGSSLAKNLASQYRYDKEIFRIEDLDNLIAVPFEGRSVMIPQRYDQLLTQLYGDYMQVPDGDKQVNKHFKKVIIDGIELD